MLGAMEDMHELDRNCIERWADSIGGRIIDAGCGPGHWTDHLHKRGADVSGIDVTTEFIDSARLRFPDVPFHVSTFRNLDVDDGSLDGVLAWYSLIHLPPAELPMVLTEFARVLSPQGQLLLGFFEGESEEPFDHAITTAYYWSIEQMDSLLNDAGFKVAQVEQRQDPGRRNHAAIGATVR